jgi:hypothetical protein
MVAVSCLSINGFYLRYARHLFGGSRKLKIFLLCILHTPCGKMTDSLISV